MQKSKKIIGLVVIFSAAAIGWIGLSTASNNNTAAANITEVSGNGPLDGMTFTGALGPDGKPKDTKDTFVFADGKFVSTECEVRCKYPARPYFVRNNGDRTEFVSETQCPYKDAKIVWRGEVQGDSIRGVATWTIRRWYWTVENKFEFEGKLAKQPMPATSSN